jgi:hypothetical protein
MPAAMTNGFDGDLLAGYLTEIDRADDEIEGHKLECKEACETARQVLKDMFVGAKEAGLNMASFRALVAAHRAERRIDKKIAAMEADDAADYEMMCEALGILGDTPLGAAALANVKPGNRESEQVNLEDAIARVGRG